MIPALAAVVTTYFALRTQRAISRRRNTLDVILTFEADQVYRDATKTYRQFRDDKIRIETLLEPRSDADQAALDQLNSFWNFHEAIALGVRSGTLDLDIMLRWWGGPMVGTWNRSAGMIGRLRHHRHAPTAFANYEIVARDFARRRGLTFVDPDPRNDGPMTLSGRV